MHDPATDSGLDHINYNLDTVVPFCENMKDLFRSFLYTPKCQYGLSLEGEQLGEQKMIITGRKAL